ncbi:MAG: gliding motility lipoprotein GldH [Muribaculaceae bacterium]|nr:gliding motility lipoprotein GldH [Muribaculaceae bacterium]
MRLRHLVIAALCVIATACIGHRYPYTAFTQLRPDGWAYGDTLTFDVRLTDSVTRGDMLIDITHDNSYPYSNLWLEITHRADSATVARDTVAVTLCDPIGKWYGRGIEGLYQLETPLKEDILLTDSTTITIRHIMRLDTIRGLSRIGLTFRSL